MPDIRIDLRGINHPFAILDANEEKKIDNLLSIISQLVMEFPMGISVRNLEGYVHSRVGFRVIWGKYKSSSLLNFISKYASSSFEMLKKTDGSILLFSVDPTSNQPSGFMQHGSGSEFYQSHPP
jgi:hypothetical protein